MSNNNTGDCQIADIINDAADAGAREGVQTKTVEVDLAHWEVAGDEVLPCIETVTDMNRAIVAAKARVGAKSSTNQVNFTGKKATITFCY